MSSIKKELYYVFMGPDEEAIKTVKGILDRTLEGQLVLTDKKLFFYFKSNISSDQKFIATHPFIKTAELKEGLIYSTLNISTKKETFAISKINKKEARETYNLLNDIISSHN